MALANTARSYGSVARSLHWLTALLILTAFPLGLIANTWPWETSDQLAVKATLFSLHKTLGVAVFAVAVLRILWAVAQPRPAALHPDRGWETGAAAVVHSLLYLSLVAVPLSGWVHHAATTGFAPIWWPLGQGLPFVPVDDRLAAGAAAAHWLFTKLLAAALVLHVAGALKHHVIDRDATQRRMWRGTPAGAEGRRGHGWGPPGVAVAVYGLATAPALALVPAAAERPALAGGAGNWQVSEGRLAIAVRQMGARVEGGFDTWVADIAFDEETRDGTVEVRIDTGSLRLGTVTAQALEPDFLDAADHPEAVFAADILGAPDGSYLAKGTLRLRGAEAPVRLPFTLRIDGDTARMEGTATIDRRDFAIGTGQTDPATLGFEVKVTVTLTAHRG